MSYDFYLELAFFGRHYQHYAVQTRDDIDGVPSRPVVLRSRRFVLAMMFFCLSQELRHRGNVKIADPSPRQPGCDLLQQPAVAIRIMEEGERVVTRMGRVRTIDAETSK